MEGGSKKKPTQKLSTPTRIYEYWVGLKAPPEICPVCKAKAKAFFKVS